MPETSQPATFCRQHFAALAIAVLALAAFNLLWRVNLELVSEWDESLYATSAWEMLRSGRWIATTFLGNVDYYNVKPPLNVWLLAASFKALGVNLVSMRIVSALSACCTVAVLMVWARRFMRQPLVALLAGVVLSACFAFVYVHAGRSGNTDSLFTLLILLTVVTLWAAQERPWSIVWLGPVAAGVFLLKGMAVLMPVAIILAVESWRYAHGRRREWRAVACAALLFVVPVGAWTWARWRVDQAHFLDRLFFYDFVGGTLTALEGHEGGLLYYADVLQKYHYDWLVAGAVALFLFPIPWSEVRKRLTFWREENETRILLWAWAAVTVLVPTLMQTKNSWYLQPFYPAFALGVASLIARGLVDPPDAPGRRRRQTYLAAIVVVAFLVAEGRLVAYSYSYRDLANSTQGLLLDAREQLAGHQVFGDRWNFAELFVLRALVGAEHRTAPDADAFLRESAAGSYFMSPRAIDRPELQMVGSNRRYWLYRRQDTSDSGETR